MIWTCSTTTSKGEEPRNWFLPCEIVRPLIQDYSLISCRCSSKTDVSHGFELAANVRRSWLDRIPFTVLLGISTSVEIFEGRLPRSCVSMLRGKHFEVQEAGNCVDRIYEALQTDQNGKIWLGRNMTSTLFEKASDFFQTPEAFSRTVKVSAFLIPSFHKESRP